MPKEFTQVEWDEATRDDCRQLTRLAIREDLGRWMDLTTISTIPPDVRGEAELISRQSCQIAGLRTIPVILEELNADIEWTAHKSDGQAVEPSASLGQLRGDVRDMLTAERLLLNLIAHLCGIATLTRAYLQATEGTGVRLYDTRKTTPGMRRLEKWAVRCGGGHNHRTGLYDAVLIKDNHLACRGQLRQADPLDLAQLVRAARDNAIAMRPELRSTLIVEVEVDTLDQLEQVLPAQPDIVLLDNMPPQMLRQAVAIRDQRGPAVELEASGGVRLETIRQIAETGVDRISVGAMTHQATAVDLGLDWSFPDTSTTL